MLISMLQILFFLGFPALSHPLSQKWKFFKFLGPVGICYAAGIIIGNIPGLELNNKLSSSITEAAILIAIPLLLFPTEFIKWLKLAPKTVLSFVFACLSIMITAFSLSFAFKASIENIPAISGMMVGVYTGGTVNMSAIALALNISEEVFLSVNIADLICSACFLFFIISVGREILAKFLLPFDHKDHYQAQSVIVKTHSPDQKPIKFLLGPIMATVFAIVSAGLSQLVLGSLHVPTILLTLTTLSILASFNPQMRRLPYTSEIGEYVLLIFCLAIGSMANLSELIHGNPMLFLFCALIIVSSFVLHVTFAKIFKIDRDTTVITSIACLFGPAFVGPVARAYDNQAVIISGMTTGLVGYAVGNYLGLLMAWILSWS